MDIEGYVYTSIFSGAYIKGARIAPKSLNAAEQNGAASKKIISAMKSVYSMFNVYSECFIVCHTSTLHKQ